MAFLLPSLASLNNAEIVKQRPSHRLLLFESQNQYGILQGEGGLRLKLSVLKGIGIACLLIMSLVQYSKTYNW